MRSLGPTTKGVLPMEVQNVWMKLEQSPSTPVSLQVVLSGVSWDNTRVTKLNS